MIVVTTPTGKIRSQVVEHLLAANEAVRVIVRDPAKLAPDIHGKVDAVQGSSDDGNVLLELWKVQKASSGLYLLRSRRTTIPSTTYRSPGPRATRSRVNA